MRYGGAPLAVRPPADVATAADELIVTAAVAAAADAGGAAANGSPLLQARMAAVWRRCGEHLKGSTLLYCAGLLTRIFVCRWDYINRHYR